MFVPSLRQILHVSPSTGAVSRGFAGLKVGSFIMSGGLAVSDSDGSGGVAMVGGEKTAL